VLPTPFRTSATCYPIATPAPANDAQHYGSIVVYGSELSLTQSAQRTGRVRFQGETVEGFSADGEF